MSTRFLYGGIGAWIALVAMMFVAGLMAGVSVTTGLVALVVSVAVIPPAIAFHLVGGPETPTVSEMLRRQ